MMPMLSLHSGGDHLCSDSIGIMIDTSLIPKVHIDMLREQCQCQRLIHVELCGIGNREYKVESSATDWNSVWSPPSSISPKILALSCLQVCAKSLVKGFAFVCHAVERWKYQWRKCVMLYLLHSLVVRLLLFIFVTLVGSTDRLGRVSFGYRDANPYIKECLWSSYPKSSRRYVHSRLISSDGTGW